MNKSTNKRSDTQNEVQKGYTIGFIIIIFFIILNLYIISIKPSFGQIKKDLSYTLIGFEYILISLLIIFSYFFPNKSFLFRFIIGITSTVRGFDDNKNYSFLWAGLAAFFGIIILLISTGLI